MGKSQGQRLLSGFAIEEEMQKEKVPRIHDRFLRDHEFRVRLIEGQRDEEDCRRWDVLAERGVATTRTNGGSSQ